MKKYLMPITESVEMLCGNICAGSPAGGGGGGGTTPVPPLVTDGDPTPAPGRRLTYAD